MLGDSNDKRLMTVKDVADYTQLSVPTIRKYIINKMIPFHKLNGRIRFFPQEIIVWIENNACMSPKQLYKKCNSVMLENMAK
jgi:excisionase family DNA binding protein